MFTRVCRLAGALTFCVASHAEAAPLAAHRATYELTLAEPSSTRPSLGASAPTGARGLIAYEFRGSPCAGYASDFRMGVELERSEGQATTVELQSLVAEDGDGRQMSFEIESRADGDAAPISGRAVRSTDGNVTVDLTKPTKEQLSLGAEILFPTQHLERVIDAARQGVHTLEATVYDGSDTGKKVFQTLAVIGKEDSVADAPETKPLQGHVRWPVVISYFDRAHEDAEPEVIMSFDLYDDGVTGDLKLDYGDYALSGRLTKLEMLPQKSCPN